MIIVSIRPSFFVAWAKHRISMIFLCTLFVGPPRWTSSSSIELLALCAFKRCAVRACHCDSRTLFPIQCTTGYTYKTSNGLCWNHYDDNLNVIGFERDSPCGTWIRKLCPLLIYLDFPSICSSEAYQKTTTLQNKKRTSPSSLKPMTSPLPYGWKPKNRGKTPKMDGL